ncbi:MAG TPA: hypothetical protein VF092_16390 [Longimicrobium sp.]
MRRLVTSAVAVIAFALAGCTDAPTLPGAREPGTTTPRATLGGTLHVTNLFCEDTGPSGGSYHTTACSGEVSGGTGGNTFNWNVIQTYREDGPESSYIEGVCSPGTYLTVTFTVTDSSGATAQARYTFRCYTIMP